MFTGLIEEIGVVKSIERVGGGIYITVSSEIVIKGTQIGDSITIDGACQTVTRFGEDCFTVFASIVTCEQTTLGNFQIGRRVNMERALSPNSRMGGHIVQGHIDGKGVISGLLRDGNGMRIQIEVPDQLLKYIADKGSVAVNGVSLTVVSVTDGSFNVYIIPETISNTTLNDSKQGDEVNIEVDILAKYVEKMLGSGKEHGQRTDERLRKKLLEEGYI